MRDKLFTKKYKNLCYLILCVLILTGCGSGDPLDISRPKESIVISENKSEDSNTMSENQGEDSGNKKEDNKNSQTSDNDLNMKSGEQTSGNDLNAKSGDQISENALDTKSNEQAFGLDEEEKQLLANMEIMDTTMYAMRSVNVRSGPGKAYEKLGSLSAGEKVHVTGLLETGWFQIAFGNETGYVASSFLLKENSGSQPTADPNAGNAQSVPVDQSTTPAAGTEQSTQTTTQTTSQVATTSGLSGTHQSTFAQRVIELVNVERTNNGLAALGTKTELMNAASKRAEESSILFEHARPDGRGWNSIADDYGISYQYLGENLAARQTTPEQVVQSWMASAGHRANILDPGYANIGVGCFLASDGYYYWAQLFTN